MDAAQARAGKMLADVGGRRFCTASVLQGCQQQMPLNPPNSRKNICKTVDNVDYDSLFHIYGKSNVKSSTTCGRSQQEKHSFIIQSVFTKKPCPKSDVRDVLLSVVQMPRSE